MMHLQPLTPTLSLNKAYLRLKPTRERIDIFKKYLTWLLDQVNDHESEEFHKHLLVDFLKNGYYSPHHFINTKGRNDLVIHQDKDPSSPVAVILEVKRPSNKAEMPKPDHLQVKAIYELLLYYLRERISGKNLAMKQLIATNIYEWFIFDATVFEQAFAQDKALVKQFLEFEQGQLSGTTTEFFYREIAQPALARLGTEMAFTYFDVRTYEAVLRQNDKELDKQLIPLFKILSPEHILKLPFANDSNTLDRDFYNELLHIIGVTEIKEENRTLIQRKAVSDRELGSLLENTINQLDSLGKIKRLPEPTDWGESYEEQLFHVGLELVLTWVNRILFLKLLEGQLMSYHQGHKAYAFLDPRLLPNFSRVTDFFFQVLARQPHERNLKIYSAFAQVPYLNSSLFELTELEHFTLVMSNLTSDFTLSLWEATVLKDNNGKRKTGKLNTLTYFLEFLNAYDFGSEGAGEIQEGNKSLINAAVLGLIFEKINGYKEGSFFTPGFITMYICRETLERAVIQKFNEEKGWHCETFTELQDKITDRREANELINGLRICDPAVGSGHFLVSALNEIIAIKSRLNILQDRQGRRLKEYRVEVVHDELVVIDNEDGEIFKYNPKNPEKQRIQELLFHEKQTLIEQCLFGVDINSNSVNICRLRLWIELLKHAYYNRQGQLETLPNIDINIKVGNSLVSRFPLEADLRQVLQNSPWTIESYQAAVQRYRESTRYEEKRDLQRFIQEIKQSFRMEMTQNDPQVKQLHQLSAELARYQQQPSLFATQEQEEQLQAEINRLKADLEARQTNPIFQKAFEWRFEFPEVLNNDGDFVGFDVVMGNPPYIRADLLGKLKEYLKQKYQVFTPLGDIFSYFHELAHFILKKQGTLCVISNSYEKTKAGQALREFILNHFTLKQYVDFTGIKVFDEATTYPIILVATKEKPTDHRFDFLKVKSIEDKKRLVFETTHSSIAQNTLGVKVWNFRNEAEIALIARLQTYQPLKEIYGKCYYGVKTGLNEAFIVNYRLSQATELHPVYEGKDIKKWVTPLAAKWMIIYERKSTQTQFGQLNEMAALAKMKLHYPEIFSHLMLFETKAKKRLDQGDYWWELRNCAYYDLFKKPKIIFPNLQNTNKFAFDETGTYLNAPAVFLPTEDKSLLGILNSKVVWYFLQAICVMRNGGYIEVKPQYFEQIPIPPISEPVKTEFNAKVTQILTAKTHHLDTAALEHELDEQVYQLYGLTEAEIALIEQAIP